MTPEQERCGCCGALIEPRDPDPWEGRLDGYCEDCALARCDAYPGYCDKSVHSPDPVPEQDEGDNASERDARQVAPAGESGLGPDCRNPSGSRSPSSPVPGERVEWEVQASMPDYKNSTATEHRWKWIVRGPSPGELPSFNFRVVPATLLASKDEELREAQQTIEAKRQREDKDHRGMVEKVKAQRERAEAAEAQVEALRAERDEARAEAKAVRATKNYGIGRAESAEKSLAELREALTELTDAISDQLGTLNFYIGPSARSAVAPSNRRAYDRIVKARDVARAALSPEEEA